MSITLTSVFPLGIGTAKNTEIQLDKDKLISLLTWRHGTLPNVGRTDKWAQSQTNLHEYPEFKPLTDWIKARAQEYWQSLGYTCSDLWFTQSWMNNMTNGGSIAYHKHANSLISGAYYFKVTPDSGGTQFETPRPYRDNEIQTSIANMTEFNAFDYVNQAEEDTVVFFPSWLNHRSLPNRVPTERYTFAFNLLPTQLGEEDNFNLAIVK